MEKASVILTIISAAIQIAMQIVNLFNNDEAKQEEIENLQDRIDQLQWELDHAEIGRVQAQYGKAIDQISKSLSEARQELAAGAKGWEKWMLYFGKASDNQKLMQKTAEKLASAYGTMKYTADKAIGEDKYKKANEQLQNLAKQQILINEQIKTERSKKDVDDDQIKEWEEKIEELGQEALEVINDMIEDIIGDTSSGIAEELADALFDAFEEGEDAAKAWGDAVNDIVADVLRRMLVSKFLEEPLGQIFDKYKAKWFPDGDFAGIDSVIDSMTEFSQDLNGTFDGFNEMIQMLPTDIRELLTKKAESAQEATYGGFETMSEDTGQELNGRFSAIQLCFENTKEILVELAEVVSQNYRQNSKNTEILSELFDISVNMLEILYTISTHTAELEVMNQRLGKIEKNTRNL